VTADFSDLETLITTVIDHGFRLHDQVGPGLLEAAYEAFLAASLRATGMAVQTQVEMSASYGEITIPRAFRIDLLIEERLIVEVKSVESLSRVHSKQLLTYLRMAQLPVGLLINFGAAEYRDGIHRIIDSRNAYRPAAHNTPKS
jgi:GxxExxY protein